MSNLSEVVVELPPGPELAQVLASVDRSTLNGRELVVRLRARSRQMAHDQAEMYADMTEIAHRLMVTARPHLPGPGTLIRSDS